MKIKIPILLLCSILLASCAQEEEQRVWNIVQVTERNIVVAVQAAGIIEPVTTVELKSKASGEILAINAETGSQVEADTLLVQIDKRTPRNALAQAQAELEAAIARRDIAKAQRNRSEQLFETGTINEVDFEQSVLEFANSKAEVVRSQVAVENARIALDDTEVRAPINGTIIQRDVEVGQVISSPTQDVGGGTELLKMADLRFVQVRSLVDETDIGKIKPGQEALVTVAAYPNQPFEGEVLKIEPQAEDEESVTLFAVIVTINNERGLLRPGMNAEVEVDISSRLGIAAVPTIALRTSRSSEIEAGAMFTGLEEELIREQLKESDKNLQDLPEGNAAGAAPGNAGYQFGGSYWLFIMQDGIPVARKVRTGLTDLDYSEILGGVEIGQDILLLPSTDLILSQDRFRKWMGDVVGVPGMKSDDEKED
ncbi:MAG: efflux RND transporter periplasmic adaptor subunit [Gammaproteobacteria bacterium]|nr:efflux RND transporter periplasmic adaptor subunit [Gammaproteobacteria bacterium]